MRSAYKILVGKYEGKRPFGRPRHRWECNIRMDLWEIRWKDVDWIHLTQHRDQWWSLVNSSGPLGSIKGREFHNWLSDLASQGTFCSM
jgi:hypothetical protein